MFFLGAGLRRPVVLRAAPRPQGRAAPGRAAAGRRTPGLSSLADREPSAPWSCSSPTPSAAAWSARCCAGSSARACAIVALDLRTHRRRHWPTGTTPSTSSATSTRRCGSSSPPARWWRWSSRATRRSRWSAASRRHRRPGRGRRHDPRRPVAVEPREPRPRLGLRRVGRARDRDLLPRTFEARHRRVPSGRDAVRADTMTTSSAAVGRSRPTAAAPRRTIHR